MTMWQYEQIYNKCSKIKKKTRKKEGIFTLCFLNVKLDISYDQHP